MKTVNSQSMDKVLDFLREKEEALSKSFITNELGMNYHTVRKALEKLTEYGIIKEIETNSAKYYKIGENE